MYSWLFTRLTLDENSENFLNLKFYNKLILEVKISSEYAIRSIEKESFTNLFIQLVSFIWDVFKFEKSI